MTSIFALLLTWLEASSILLRLSIGLIFVKNLNLSILFSIVQADILFIARTALIARNASFLAGTVEFFTVRVLAITPELDDVGVLGERTIKQLPICLLVGGIKSIEQDSINLQQRI